MNQSNYISERLKQIWSKIKSAKYSVESRRRTYVSQSRESRKYNKQPYYDYRKAKQALADAQVELDDFKSKHNLK